MNEIASAAKKAGLDFLVLTPHTPARKRNPDYFLIEGYKDGIVLIAGEEADERSGFNHVLVFGNKGWLGKTEVEKIVFSSEKESFISFAAHPDGKHRLFGFEIDHRWRKRDLLEFLTGLEVWSLLFDFASRTNPSNVVIRYLRFPENLRGPFSPTLNLWDSVAEKRKFVGVAGLDIHPLRYGIKCLDIKKTFSYEFVFRILRNHILTEKVLTKNAHQDIKAVENALRQGRIFFANDFLADSTGFFFGTQDGKFTMGDTVDLDDSLLIELPEKADVKIKNSTQTLSFKNTKRIIFKGKRTGPHRVEVYYKEKPWIFSNHMYLR
ncbi:MAG: hypothetical protein NC937_00610 [Candidatus Omnitrophica bacterium]|nr:hypothetical protein [Candidatus Omnitrophota bacterium]